MSINLETTVQAVGICAKEAKHLFRLPERGSLSNRFHGEGENPYSEAASAN